MTDRTGRTRRSRPDAERRRRLEALRAEMHRRGLDVVALTSPESVYYYAGLDHLGYFAFTLLVIPHDGAPVLVARAMERPTLRAQVPWLRHRAFLDGAGPAREIAVVLAGVVPRGGRVGLERSGMFLPPVLDAQIASAVPSATVHDVTSMLRDRQAVKSPVEIRYTRQAARISDLAMAAALAAAGGGSATGRGNGGGLTDTKVAAQAVHTMIAEGGQTPGFAPLVRPTAALDQEHVTWSGRELRPGEGLFVELSGCVQRYHAPLSRTVYLGRTPPGAKRAHAAALAGLRAAEAALCPGTTAAAVYTAWQEAVTAEGPSRTARRPPLRHHCGYLVGIGFPPSWVGGGDVLGLRADSRAVVREGMTFHLMSWTTRPLGHVVSDTVLVTADGCERLTATPRDLTVL